MNTTDKIKMALREAEEEKKEDSTKGMINGPTDIEGGDKSDENPQYDQIQELLGDNIYNHAAIVRRLWGDDNASYRSEFGKRLNKEVHDGSRHVFTDNEITAIASILQNAASSVNAAFEGPVNKDDRKLVKNYGHER